MLIIDLNNRPNLVLLERTTFRYLLYSSTKEETERVEAFLTGKTEEAMSYINDLKLLGLEVDMVGHVDEVAPTHVSNIIPKIHTYIRKKLDHYDKMEVTHEFCCYQEHAVPNKYNNIVKHEERLSSFKCACDKLQTKYFIVLKETLKEADNGDKDRDTTVHT